MSFQEELPSHHHHPGDGAHAEGGMVSRIFETYVPRRVCMFEQPDVIWTHVVSDVLITAAYFSIPFALVYFYRKRTDLAFNWVFILFAVFIFACGLTHVFQVMAVWEPYYRLEGWVKVVTAIASVGTASVLWPLIPKALALPSPAMLRAEIAERLKTEEALRKSHDQLEQRVKERTAELEELNRIKDDFLATLSHELRTPLNAILGWAQLLSMQPHDEEKHREAMQVIERNAKAQARLIADLLDMQRIISGKLYLDVRTTDLTEVVTSAVQVVRPSAEARTVSLETHFGEGLRPVWGDPDRLQQLVWNLLANAIKFTPSGGWVRVELIAEQTQMVIRVSDNGQGIAPDALRHVFEKFRQADQSTTRKYGGLGLGLAIVRHIAELHGGSVHAQSPGPGQGTTFTARLPIMAIRGEPARTTEQATDAAIPPSLEQIDLTGMRIIVVDDEKDAAHLVEEFLKRHHAEVFVAHSVAEALCLVDEQTPHLVISDIAMPGEDGYDLIRKLRERSDIPAIALTALARDEDVERATKAGYQVHLAKPVDSMQLAMTVASFRDKESQQ